MALNRARFFCRLLLPASLLFLGISAAGAQDAKILALMPLPAHMVQGEGEFLIDGQFGVALRGYEEPRLDRARDRFLRTLSRETGIPLWREAQFNTARFIIQTGGASAPVQQLGEDESYRLTVTPTEVHLTAANPLGVIRGLQTFLQLVAVTPRGFAAPAVTIEDKPRFAWRGLMIDTSRHFMPVDVIERNLDGMEAVKLNVFHWHITDDQGFRAESKTYPLLQQKGSDGLFYTQSEIREVIDYARDRGIRVVPEFDVPCHTTSWFVGYPQLASGSGPYQIARQWGVLNAAMDPSRESTYQFLDAFIGEMAGLFPDAYFHIGGDECNGKEWDANANIQAFMRAHNMKNNAVLQAYFTARVQTLVAKHGKIMEGWDEVLQPDTPKDVVIQSWRGQQSLDEAARRGYRGLLSTGYYIDLNQPAAEHYLVDPLGGEASTLTPQQQSLILGGEAAMWSEFVTPETIDTRIWPRTAAIAERLWSPQTVRDVNSMYRRLAVVAQRLQYDHLQPQTITNVMLQRMSGNPEPKALQVLAATVAPPKGYMRESLGHYDAFTPLNRMVDAVPPESDTAREFTDLAAKIAAGTATPQEWRQAREWLVQWRNNDALLQPELPQSELTADLAPVSKTLAQVATIGLQALDALQNHAAMRAEAQRQDIAFLKSAEKPQAVLRLMVVPGVEALVQAAPTW